MTKIRSTIQCTPFFTKASWEKSLHTQQFIDADKVALDFIEGGKPASHQFKQSQAAFVIAPSTVFDKAPQSLKLLYSGIAGLDSAWQQNNPTCQVTSSKGIAAVAIAEYCLMAALLLSQKFQELYARHEKRKWSQEGMLGGALQPLATKKVAVLGLGSNGMQIATTFKNMGCWVGGFSRTEKTTNALDAWHGPNDLNDLLSKADIIVLALPSLPGTREIINQRSLTLIKKDAHLINIGRGDLIHEMDLYNHMKAGGLAGAMLDVVTEEPLSRRSKLWKLDNLIITPHISGNINNHVEAIQQDYFKKLSQITSS